jgi:[glutamine synthetase] adenylyltransferase / [glutamine synthetase]-adenylyl-L-tyrosine phosphorylase
MTLNEPSGEKTTDANASGASLAERVVAAPQVASAEAAGGLVARDLADRLEPLFARYPKVRSLIEGIAEGSPYLWDLIRANPARVGAILTANPEQYFASVLALSFDSVDAAREEEEAMRCLRTMKADAALLIALADIGGVWPLQRVTRALTDLADTAVRAAVRFLLRDAVERGKLMPHNLAEPEQGSGYAVIAMGKMGAFELNYSSDIDLIVFFDPERAPVSKDADAGQLYVRVTRGLVKLLQERTGDGYVFRVDLRLRPDPASTQVAVSVPSALNYYESVGRNWERAAMIKARACAGDAVTGEAMLNGLAPFIWRKYLDFAAITDVQAMKQQIHAYKGHGEIAIEGHNLKLGRGGIREIEFFVQTQQLIAGGRHPELRGRDTLAMLAVLAEGGWISAEAREDMAAAYDFLRNAEHRLQMVADEQTQTLPADREGTERFARFLGFESRDAFADVLTGHLRNVQRHYEQLFEAAPAASEGERGFVFPAEADDVATLDNLSSLGFRNPLQTSERVRNWLAGGSRTLNEAARQHLAALMPSLLRQLAKTENPEGAFVAFDHFLVELHAGERLLSLLRQNPDLVGFIALILGTAPRLADILARYPHVIDPLLEPGFFGSLPDEAKLRAEWERAIGQTTSYEDFLDRIRMFGQEQMFLIGARILSETVSAEQAGSAFATLADVMIRALDGAVQENFAQTHGRVPAQQTALLALGKLGGREMTASSDLDLIMVYDFDADAPQSDGPRPLYGSQYFARLTQRLISALTVQTNYGVLYPVDMRLRPSGRSGPLATHLAGFESYQEHEAWTWEHLALTRARIVSASSPEFEARVSDVIRTALSRQRDVAAVAGDVVEMRRAIATEKGDSDRWDLKFAAGGLVDIEFIAQYLQLVHAANHPEILDTSTARVLDKAQRLGLLPTAEAEVLRPAVRLYQNLTQILRLCLPGAFDPKTAGAGLLRLLVRAGDVPDFAALDAHVAETQTKVRQSFVRILGEAP